MDIKEILKKNLVTILCVISLLSLAFPIITMTTEYSDEAVTGFAAINKSIMAVILIAGPVLLVAMNYIKPLENYKGLLAIGIPALCLISLIIVFFTVKAGADAGAGAFEAFGAEIEIKVGFGAILAAISYIVTGVVGLKENQNIKLKKLNLDKLKTGSSNFVGAMQEKAAQVADRVKSASTDSASVSVAEEPAKKKTVSADRTEEILSLIEKLSKMKEAGVLTEEEFVEKKKALLEEI